MWYDKAFDADNRSSVFAGLTVEELKDFYRTGQRQESQPTSFRDAYVSAGWVARHNPDEYFEEILANHDCKLKEKGFCSVCEGAYWQKIKNQDMEREALEDKI